MHGRMTEAGDERWPVCRVGMTGNTGIKDFNSAMLGFYNHAGTQRGTAAEFANRALDCVLSCETEATRCRRPALPQTAHHQRADQQPVQIHQQRIPSHHHLHRHRATTTRPLQRRKLRRRDTRSERATHHSLTCASSPSNPRHRREWRQLLLAIEKQLVLSQAPGDVGRSLGLLLERSSGRIGPLTTLINRACQRAVLTGAEYIDKSCSRKSRPMRHLSSNARDAGQDPQCASPAAGTEIAQTLASTETGRPASAPK